MPYSYQRRSERRRSQRITPPLSLFGKLRTRHARIVDISPHGARVELRSPMIPSLECTISVPVEHGELGLQALVQRCRLQEPGDGGELLFHAALEFRNLSAQDVELLEDSIVDLCLTEL